MLAKKFSFKTTHCFVYNNFILTIFNLFLKITYANFYLYFNHSIALTPLAPLLNIATPYALAWQDVDFAT
jgi:hypothetical protein